jgi:predicted lipid-binding transport protein (Tim44 family)
MNDEAEIAVRFVGEFFRTTYTGSSQTPAPTLRTCVDLWTFSRHLSSGEGGWTLVAAYPG